MYLLVVMLESALHPLVIEQLLSPLEGLQKVNGWVI
jgi:hypothetical protein